MFWMPDPIESANLLPVTRIEAVRLRTLASFLGVTFDDVGGVAIDAPDRAGGHAAALLRESARQATEAVAATQRTVDEAERQYIEAVVVRATGQRLGPASSECAKALDTLPSACAHVLAGHNRSRGRL